MILEGIVTTLGPTGEVNIAPMGPRVTAAMDHLVLRPFKTSQTFQNLKRHPEGVFHVTDDVFLLAKAALGPVEAPVRPAEQVRGVILVDHCRSYEFRIVAIEESQERTTLDAVVVHTGWQRDLFGFNRAKHAVVEAAILATRTDFLSLDDIDCEYRKLEVVVQKTGGDQEREAFAFLRNHVDAVRRGRQG